MFLTTFGKYCCFIVFLSLFYIAAVNVNSVGSVFFWGFKMFYSFSDALQSGAEKILEDIVPINLGKRYTPCKFASVCRVFKCVFTDVCVFSLLMGSFA